MIQIGDIVSPTRGFYAGSCCTVLKIARDAANVEWLTVALPLDRGEGAFPRGEV